MHNLDESQPKKLEINGIILEQMKESSAISQEIPMQKRAVSMSKLSKIQPKDKLSESYLSSAPSIDSENSITMPVLHIESTAETSQRRKAV